MEEQKLRDPSSGQDQRCEHQKNKTLHTIEDIKNHKIANQVWIHSRKVLRDQLSQNDIKENVTEQDERVKKEIHGVQNATP